MMHRKTVILAMLCVAYFSSSCVDESRSFPPSSDRFDDLAKSIGDAELNIRIDADNPILYSGLQDLVGQQFVPSTGELEVTSGTLISTLGSIQRTASFGGWSYIRNGSGGIVGYGFDITDGEAIVPNVFLADVNTDLHVTNRFSASNLGANYTLIELDPTKDHRMTVQYLIADGSGLFGSMRARVEEATFSGGVLLAASPDLIHPSETEDAAGFFAITSASFGTTVHFESRVFRHKNDGWYEGDARADQ